MHYPKDSQGNLSFRAGLLSRADADKSRQFRAALYEMCSRDILFFFNALLWTFDAKGDKYKALGYRSPHIPFITFPFQDLYIMQICGAIDGGRDTLTEKSRDMGATWIISGVFLWYWMFKGPGNDFLIGSRKEQAVDRIGDMSSIFPKIRYLIRRLPHWMLPPGFSHKEHDNYLRLVNPDTGSVISGEATNPNFGTGGRTRACFLDEFAKWGNTDAAAWQSLSDVTNCKLPVSSANGRNNHFYRLRNGDAGEIEVITLRWQDHPLKDKKWYNAEKRRRSPEDLAAEVDIDYSASVPNKAFPYFSESIHVTSETMYEPDLPLELSCDFNMSAGNPMSWSIAQTKGNYSCYIDEISKENSLTEDCMKIFCERYVNHRKKVLYLFGDASGKYGSTKSRRSDYDIIQSIAAAYKWQVVMHVPRANPGHRDSINAVNKRLQDFSSDGKSWVLVHHRCKHIIESMEQTQRKDDGIDKNGSEHMSDTIRYREAYKYPVISRTVVNTRRSG